MRFWPFHYTQEEVPALPYLGKRRWRWVFEIQPHRRWGLSIGVVEEVLFEQEGSEWHDAVRYYGVHLTSRFALGSEHIYYDGPHCQFSLGWLHIAWAPEWCLKCMPPQKQ